MTPPAAHITSRVFYALWPDASVCEALASLSADCAARTGGRAPPASNLHLTLAFIGDVTQERVSTLREIGPDVAAAVPPFTLTLDRIGAFGKQGITWAGPSSVVAALGRLASALSDTLAAVGFDLERRAFHPHVTLVRRGRTRMPDSARGGVRLAAPVVWNVSRLTLAASEATRAAPRYVALDGWALGNVGGPM